MFEEVVEDLDLVLGQLRHLPAVRDGAVLQVQPGAIPGKDLSGLGTGSRLSQQGGDLGQQDRRIVRLCDKGVPAQHDAVELVHVRVAAGDKDDRQVGESPDLGADLKAAAPRELDVQEDEVGRKRPELLHRIRKVRNRFHLIPVSGQEVFQLCLDGGIILDNQNFLSHNDTSRNFYYTVSVSISQSAK